MAPNEFESGGTGLERKWGGIDTAQNAGKIFWGRAPPLFGSKSTISCFGERFRDGQYSLVSFFFAVLLLTVPPYPAICKSGGTCPRAPWSRRNWLSCPVCLLLINTIMNSSEIHCS